MLWIGALSGAQSAMAQATPRSAQAQPFTTPLSPDEMKGKQAVVSTALGDIVIELLPDAAPNHVGYFMKLASEGGYDGTTFHRAIKHGIIQGGDPLSKDPARRALYGTGGLGMLKAERSAEKHTAGAVSAVIQPGRPDSAGAQFFICVTGQPALDGQYTVFGRVVEGLEVAQKISEVPTDADGRITDRVDITRISIRNTPPPEVAPFSTETVDQLATWRAVLDTSMGAITLDFMPGKAPEHVRNFLRLATLGVYDGTAFHRVVPGFVVQTGSMTSRASALTARQQKAVSRLQPEFNDTKHTRGIVSMARGDDLASATTSFFIVLAPTPGLDGKYTVFGQVVAGLDVVEAIERVPLEGESPKTRIELRTVRLEQKSR